MFIFFNCLVLSMLTKIILHVMYKKYFDFVECRMFMGYNVAILLITIIISFIIIVSISENALYSAHVHIF